MVQKMCLRLVSFIFPDRVVVQGNRVEECPIFSFRLIEFVLRAGYGTDFSVGKNESKR